jgi:hypothetical protein
MKFLTVSVMMSMAKVGMDPAEDINHRDSAMVVDVSPIREVALDRWDAAGFPRIIYINICK